jgi:hypothetical protein
MGSLSRTQPPGVNLDVQDPEFERLLAMVVNNILRGKLHNTGSVIFVHGGVSTTVSDIRCGINSVVFLMATNDDGAAALDTWRVSTITDGAFTVTHVSTSTSTAAAKYAIFG